MKKVIATLTLVLGVLLLGVTGNVAQAETYNEEEWVEATIEIPVEESNSLSRAVTFPCMGDVTGNGVNLRKTASFSGTILELMYKGETVYINYAKSSKYYNGYRWLYIKRAKTGTVGYVYEKYVNDQS